MESREGQIDPGPRVVLTEQQARARKLRNIAIGFGLLALVSIFYVATITKFGPRLMDRPIITLGES